MNDTNTFHAVEFDGMGFDLGYYVIDPQGTRQAGPYPTEVEAQRAMDADRYLTFFPHHIVVGHVWREGDE